MFDIKEYMKQKKAASFNNMLNNAGNSGGAPLFSGPNPFDALKNTNQEPKPSPMPGSGLNVDELVKKIDAKIAELEQEEKLEEEKRKKEAQAKKEKQKEEKKEKNNTPDNSNMFSNLINKDPEKIKERPEIKREPPKKSEVSKIAVTDDQFFDDFFDE